MVCAIGDISKDRILRTGKIELTHHDLPAEWKSLSTKGVINGRERKRVRSWSSLKKVTEL